MTREERLSFLQAKRAVVDSQLTRAEHGRRGLPLGDRRRAQLEREAAELDRQIAELGGVNPPPGAPPALRPRKDLGDDF